MTLKIQNKHLREGFPVVLGLRRGAGRRVLFCGLFGLLFFYFWWYCQFKELYQRQQLEALTRCVCLFYVKINFKNYFNDAIHLENV